jgi:hypothetical protein
MADLAGSALAFTRMVRELRRSFDCTGQPASHFDDAKARWESDLVDDRHAQDRFQSAADVADHLYVASNLISESIQDA